MGDERTWIMSHCQQCFNACGILVEIVNGMPSKIIGDPSDPNIRGKLCPRGLSGPCRSGC